MADRYWVGGTASWDGTAGTKWATTSGGVGGASVPTSADDVFFDAASGVVTCTLTGGVCRNLNCTGFTGTITVSGSNWDVYGSITFSTGMTFNSGGLTVNIRGSLATITSNGKSIGSVNILGTYTLNDACATGSCNISAGGSLNTAGYNFSTTNLTTSGVGTRTLTLGASTVTSSIWNISNTVVFSAGTSTINQTGATFNGFNLTYNNINVSGNTTITGNNTFNNATFTSAASIQGNCIFNNFTVNGPASAGVLQITFGAFQTINGILSTTGTAGNRRVWFAGLTYGIGQTLTVNASSSLTDADFRDIYVVGTAAPIGGTRIGNRGNCTGIAFSTPKTVFWVTAAGGSWSGNNWAASSGGAASTDNFPLPQDTATIENTGLNTSATVTLDNVITYTGTVAMGTRTNAMTLSLATGYTVYGNWINGSGTTLSGAQVLTFSSTSTQTITSAGKTFSGGITVDAYGGTVELADAFNIGSNTLTITNGTFNTKNFSATAGALSSSNTNVRTVNLGSSTITLSGATPIVLTTTTNLTFNPGTSQIACNGNGQTFNGNGLTYYNLSFTSTTVQSGQTITGANTFNNITCAGPASIGYRTTLISANQTITGTLTLTDTSDRSRRHILGTNAQGTAYTLTCAAVSVANTDFVDITISGSAAPVSGTSLGNCGNNNGITFTAATTVYRVGSSTSWRSNSFSNTSGGAANTLYYPLPQDTVVIDNNTTGTNIQNSAQGDNLVFPSLDCSTRTTSFYFGFNQNFSAFTFYGGLKLNSNITIGTLVGITNTLNTLALYIPNKSVTLDFNGATILAPSYGMTISGANATVSIQSGTNASATNSAFLGFNSINGTFTFLNALSINSILLTNGTMDLNGKAIDAIGLGVAAGTNKVIFSGNTLTLSGSGTVFDNQNAANFVCSGSGTIKLTSASAKTFAGGSYSFANIVLDHNGTGTLTITGNNFFKEFTKSAIGATTISLGATTQTFGTWSVTGTAGNVVTVTGTATLTIAGAATSGLDYLAMGTTALSTTSPGEFYAGVNSTGTGAGITLTAPPAGRTLYWVGGTGNWSATTSWSTTSGGASGAAVPTSLDDVNFNSASNATAYTATIDPTQARCKSLTVAGPASGNLTLAGTGGLACHNNVSLPATGLTRTYTGAITLTGSTIGRTITTNGNALASAITVNGVGCEWTLGSALDMGSSTLTVTNGIFKASTYNVTAGALSSDNGNSRTVDFGSSTLTLSGATPVSFGTTEINRASLTVTAGTSQITATGLATTFNGNNQTFYNVSFTSTGGNNVSSIAITGANTFNNLAITCPSGATGSTYPGTKPCTFAANQTINGTFSSSAAGVAAYRLYLSSSSRYTSRTLNCAATSLINVDFEDIQITGAAAPVSGTRLGDCGGNSGINFSSATKYWNFAAGGLWTGTVWATTSGGTPNDDNYPLPQDTCIIEATGLNSGSTISFGSNAGGYKVPALDLSARTSNTVTLSILSLAIRFYGDLILASGVSLSTTSGSYTFCKRTGTQTVTSAGKTLSNSYIDINNVGGSLVLNDAMTITNTTVNGLTFTAGAINLNGYTLTIGNNFSGGTLPVVATDINFGSGGSLVSANNINMSSNVSGTGSIVLNSASAKTFTGNGRSFPNITLVQAGAGTLTITGNNTFANITNTYKATGATTIALGNTVQRVAAFTAAGEATRLLTITGTSAASPATLVYTGVGTISSDYLTITGIRAYPTTSTWYAGTNSVNNGSLGWSFGAAPVSQATYTFFYFF